MKITAVRTHALMGRSHDSGWETAFDPGQNIHTLVEVTTDAGLTGWGSAYTTKALADAALQFMRPHLIGEHALEPERVCEKLHQTTFWHGRGGTLAHAISGVDIALWDLLGQATGQPISRLLGGCYRDRIKPYGSILFEPPEKLRATLQGVVARGFKAVKLGWGSFGRVSRAHDELLVQTAREAVGPGVELMVDAGASEQFWPHGYKWALETARMLAAYDITWFEEALPPDNLDDFAKLREHSPVPISTGEVLTRRQSFQPWVERRAADILQPDCTKVGGLSEMKKIAWMAHDHGIQLIPHGWNTAIGLAADLHLAAAMPVARYVEYMTPSFYIEDIVKTPFQLDADGLLLIPTKPGLGLDLDVEAIQRLGRPGQ